MTKPTTRFSAKQPTQAREAFERHQVPVWLRRYGGHEHRRAAPGTFVHSYAVIVLVTKGQGRVRHTGDLVLRAGDVHLIPPGDAHGSAQLEALEGWALAFHPEALVHDDASWGTSPGPQLGPLLRVRSGCHPVLRPSAAQRKRLEGWMHRGQRHRVAVARAGGACAGPLDHARGGRGAQGDRSHCGPVDPRVPHGRSAPQTPGH